MKRLLLSLAVLTAPLLHAQTHFTYQGKLENSGAPFTGNVHIRLALHSTASGGSAIRTEVMPNILVTNGIFTVMPATFTAADFPGANRWLNIEVSGDGGANYTALTPRQQVTWTPMALHAATAASAATATTVSGNVPASQIGGGTTNATLTFGNGGATFSSLVGVAPFNVSNSTKVPNLNSDLFDGLDSAAFLQRAGGTMTGPLGIANGTTLNFGNQARQMINLFNSDYAIGIQANTLYHRSANNYAWFRGGAHNDNAFNAGSGGSPLMTLDAGGYLELTGTGSGYGLFNRDDSTKRWVAYASGAGTGDAFRIWSGETGNRFSVGQNGDATLAGKLTAAGIFAASASNSGGNIISAVQFTSTGNGAALHGATGSSSGFAVLGEGADGGYGGKFTCNGAAGWAVYGVSDLGFAGRFDGKLAASGATTLSSTLSVAGATTLSNEVTTQGSLAGYALKNRNDQSKRWVMYSRNVGGSDQLIFYSDTAGDVASLQPNGDFYLDGNLSTTVLTIRGGADVAEPFEMTRPDDMEPGTVVVIDEENEGHLMKSTQSYDTRVAGIISGAGGVKPGLRLHQEGVMEGDHHVALSGRVYVKADASFGKIKPGDLLTTSATPGHAMKVKDHEQAQGAILGKAMSKLDKGTGLVLVLVTLQ